MIKHLHKPPWHFFLALFLILLSAFLPSHLAYSSPAPTQNLTCEPGGCNSSLSTCTDNIWLDGTTPIDTVVRGTQIVGTAGQDIGAFVTSVTTTGDHICYSSQNFVPTTSTIITANNVEISGTGGTTFTPVSGTFDIFTENGFDFRIHDINFEMTNGGGWAVNIGSSSSSNRCWAYNLNIHNPQTGGIKLGFNSGLCFVNNNRVQSTQSPSSAGILVQGVDSHVYDNDAGGFVNAGGGISCSRCANVDFQGNMLYSNFIGIDLYLPERIRVVGNQVEYNHYEGVRVTVDSTAGAWQGITISANVFKNNDNFAPHTVGAIHLTSSGTAQVANIAVTGNVAYDTQTPKTQNVGLLVDNANVVNVTVTDNVFLNNIELQGISITAGTKIYLSNNLGALDYTKGLSLWWKLDDGTGTNAYDSSGNGVNGTLTSTPIWTDCMFKYCLYFSGINYVTKNSGFTMPSSYSLNFWFYANATAYVNGNQFLFGQFQTASNNGIMVWIPNTNTVSFRMYDSSITSHTCTTTPIVQNYAWNMITVTFNSISNGMTIYINSNPITTGCIFSGTLPTYNGILDLGIAPSQALGFKGYIDDFRVYNAELTQQQISQIYSYLKTGPQL